MTDNIETTVIKIISDIVGKRTVKTITPGSRFKQDLGFDSLTMLEMCVEVEGKFNVAISEKLSNVQNVSDIVALIENSNPINDDIKFNIKDYPLPKSKKHVHRLKRLMCLSRVLWQFKVNGLENIPANGQYILCPNHQSHFDGLWIWTALRKREIDLNKICCLAKQEHIQESLSGLIMLGGIPVDRSGNTVPAMKRALDCIQNGYLMLIHPEGTRTLDRRIQEFKGGAAKLAIDAGVPLIPVHIDGAWDIYPPHRKRPKIFRLGRRYPIKISFGKPIFPENKSIEELTVSLQNEVEKMGVK